MAYFRKDITKTRSVTVYSKYGTTLTANFVYGFRHKIVGDNSYTISGSSFTPNAIAREPYSPELITTISGSPVSSSPRFDIFRDLTAGYRLGNSSQRGGLDDHQELVPRYTLLYGSTVLGYWQPAVTSGSTISGADRINGVTPSADPRRKEWYRESGSAIGSFNESFISFEASNKTYYFSGAISTSTLFNTSNKTAKAVTLTISAILYSTQEGPWMDHLSEVGIHIEGTIPYEDYSEDDQTYSFAIPSTSEWAHETGFSGNIGSITVTLSAPPTFSASAPYFTKNYRRSDAGVYRGYTSVSVDISNLSAKYGGDITSVVFKVANKSVSGTTNGTYTIVLDENTMLGTYTPTVTVTDSRGQVTTQSFTEFPITILGYSAPNINATSVIRTDATGAPADEGTYALITTSINWLDFLEALEEPTVTYVDENGLTQTASVTWYTDSALQHQVQDWTALTSPVTLYGLTGGLSYLYAYPITVTPEDTRTTGNPSTFVLPPAFYTMDFRAGGHGIAIGAPATTDEFYIAMDTTINMDTDFRLELDTNASSGADHDIIAAINSLGWTDVLKN